MIRILLLFALIGVVVNASCEDGLWGDDCTQVCGFCLDKHGEPAMCDNKDGDCPLRTDGTPNCVDGWRGYQCNEPTCDSDCHGYTCIAPNTCFCGDEINKVAPTCEDLRVRGMYGSITALITLTLSIFLCGVGSNHWDKKRQKRRAMMQKLQLVEDEQ